MITNHGARNRFRIVRFSALGGERHDSHGHKTPHLFFLTSGSMEEEVGTESKTLSPSTLRLSRAAARHNVQFGREGGDCVTVHLSDLSLRASLENGTDLQSKFINHKARDLVSQFLHHADEPSKILDAEVDLHELMGHAACDVDRETPDWLIHSRALLRSSDDLSQSVSDVACQVGVSREHLTRCYKATFGLSPVAVKQASQLSAALTMLHGSDLCLADVAGEAGFCDQAHLSNLMKTRLGQTPGQARSHVRSHISNTH